MADRHRLMEGGVQLTVEDLKARLDNGEDLILVDVREPREWKAGNLEAFGARSIPMGDLLEKVKELDPGSQIVLHCRSGGRSARAVRKLREAGFARVHSLSGGIKAWQEMFGSC